MTLLTDPPAEATLDAMASTNPKNDRHKPRRMVGIPEPLAAALEQLANEQFNSLTDQVKTACREYLDRQGRLPKPSGRRK